jgi:hypothetical protein
MILFGAQASTATKANSPSRYPGGRALMRKHGVVDVACSAALEMGVPTYHVVRRYLGRNPTGELPHVRIVNSIRVRPPDLAAYLDLVASSQLARPVYDCYSI